MSELRKAVVWFGLSLLVGCGALIDPGAAPVACEVSPGDGDPCRSLGLRCSADSEDGISGFCEQCVARTERCNGLDDDCDGTTDEGPDGGWPRERCNGDDDDCDGTTDEAPQDGWPPEDCNGLDDDCDDITDEGHDEDGDGFTWCGGGKAELRDCVPTDAKIHPSVGGALDGEVTAVEELCDGIDNDCDTAIDEEAGCEGSGSCSPGSCPGELVCDTSRSVCVAPQATGSSCSQDAQCAHGFCVGADALGLDVLGTGDGLCAVACCTNADCDSGAVCLVSGTGARVCVRPEIAGRGTTESGGTCQRDIDCASGVCDSRTCRAGCSSDAQCGDDSCTLGETLLTGEVAWACRASSGRGDTGSLCTGFDPTACRSGLCVGAQCAGACGTSEDCPSDLECGYMESSGLLDIAGGGGGRVAACVQNSAGRVCCTSANCASGQQCRATQLGGDWGMFCSE